MLLFDKLIVTKVACSCRCPNSKAFQKIKPRLVREVEKKFSAKVFIAQRRILPKPTRTANKLKQKQPILGSLVEVQFWHLIEVL